MVRPSSDLRNKAPQTALILAADRKDVELLKILINRRVDLDAQDTLGRTALHSAVRSNSFDCFELLLTSGANPTLQTFARKTPAILAAEFGRASILRHRLAHGTRPVTKEELQAAYAIAARNERDHKYWQIAYRTQGVELSDQSDFKQSWTS